MRIRFDEIRRTRKRSGPCATCGKPTTQTLAVSQTINPYNLDASTQRPKTAAQIQKELSEELQQMSKAPLRCSEHREQ